MEGGVMGATEDIFEFVRESNRIEGITREPTKEEIAATLELARVRRPCIDDLRAFVWVCAPGNVLRDKNGLNVRVGDHIAPSGGPEIRTRLDDLLARAAGPEADPWAIHVEYETLHPFTDGNGRSGRALWLNMMLRRGAYVPFRRFLHDFYYQTLSGVRRAPIILADLPHEHGRGG
jgi:hypothetical protein